MNRAMMLLAAGLLTVVACDNKPGTDSKTEDPASKNTPTITAATGTAATTPAAAVAPVIADTDLATPADFEETAGKTISKTNYKAELATLETELAKD